MRKLGWLLIVAVMAVLFIIVLDFTVVKGIVPTIMFHVTSGLTMISNFFLAGIWQVMITATICISLAILAVKGYLNNVPYINRKAKEIQAPMLGTYANVGGTVVRTNPNVTETAVVLKKEE